MSAKQLAQVGRQFLLQSASVMEGADGAAKTNARGLVSAVTAGSNVLKSKKFRLVRKGTPLGRPIGSQRVSDKDLSEALQEHSYPCPGVNVKLGIGNRALRASKRRAAKASGIYKRSQLMLRLRRNRLAISKVPSEKGKCDYCHSWRQGSHKRVEHLLADSRKFFFFGRR